MDEREAEVDELVLEMEELEEVVWGKLRYTTVAG